MAHLKFASPFGHKVLNFFHLSINQKQMKVIGKSIIGKQSGKVVQATPDYGTEHPMAIPGTLSEMINL